LAAASNILPGIEEVVTCLSVSTSSDFLALFDATLAHSLHFPHQWGKVAAGKECSDALALTVSGNSSDDMAVHSSAKAEPLAG